LSWFLFLGVGGHPDEGRQLVAEEVDFSLKTIDVVARAIERVASAVPHNQKSNSQNNDQQEFHR
jgi:hypothetical protein